MIIKQEKNEKILKVICDEKGIQKAVNIIKKGGVIIFPTDTVYGIGCDPYNKEAVEKIYEIKSRENTKFLPVLVYSKDVAEQIAFFDEMSKKIADKFWPGPLTIILKVRDNKLKKSLNIKDKIALRVPDHKCTLALLNESKFLVGTSANISGQASFTNPDKCSKDLKNYDLFLDGGKINSKMESTIIEIENEKIRIIREGSLNEEELMRN